MNPDTRTIKSTGEVTTDQDHDRPVVVQRRLIRQGRRRLLRLSPLGWWLFDMVLAFLAVMLGYLASPHVGLFFVPDVQHLAAVPCAVSFSLLLGIVA